MSGLSVIGSFLYDRLFYDVGSEQLFVGLVLLFAGLVFFPFGGQLLAAMVNWVYQWALPEAVMNVMNLLVTGFRWFGALFGAVVALYATAILLAWSFATAGLIEAPWSVSK
jgi:Na+/phosphate symporter